MQKDSTNLDRQNAKQYRKVVAIKYLEIESFKVFEAYQQPLILLTPFLASFGGRSVSIIHPQGERDSQKAGRDGERGTSG